MQLLQEPRQWGEGARDQEGTARMERRPQTQGSPVAGRRDRIFLVWERGWPSFPLGK